MNVHLKTQSSGFTARFNKKINANPKDSVSVDFDVNKGHFFDIDNENIL